MSSRKHGPVFPRYFEAQYSDFSEDLPLWLDLAAASGGATLELGCGSGRVLLALARAGHSVEGLDSDPAALRRAEVNLRSAHLTTVRLHQADLRNFALQRAFGLILVPCNTFATLTDPDAASALACARRHLPAGGQLALEIPNPYHSHHNLDATGAPLSMFRDPQTGHPIQLYARQRFDPVAGRADVVWYYDELHPDGRVQRTEAHSAYYLREPETMRGYLRQASFGGTQFLGDYDRRAFTRRSPCMIVLARAEGQPGGDFDGTPDRIARLALGTGRAGNGLRAPNRARAYRPGAGRHGRSFPGGSTFGGRCRLTLAGRR